MSVKQLFESGDLSGAIAAANEEVRANPADTRRRTFLFELLAFAGELDRAERQLGVIAHQDPQSEWPAQVYGNLLAAERARRRFYSEGLKPEFLLDPPPYADLHCQAANRLREKRAGEASGLLEQSAEARPALAGRIDGQAFDEFCDCDDLVAPFLELFVLRDYVWVPFEQIRELEISPPERPRDLLWAAARIVLSDASQRRGYVPVLYHGSHEHADDQVKLGRSTDWQASEAGPVLGVGQRVFLVGEADRAILETRSVEFAA
ncbi:MAG: type VI secretion system accessory protein TagJ [Pirellulales bacterium]